MTANPTNSPAADPPAAPDVEPPGLGLDAEWLLTDGLGGFACGPVGMVPARRYHGLLLAPGAGTAERYLYLGFFDESVEVGSDRNVPLSERRHREGSHGESAGAHPPALDQAEVRTWPHFTFRLRSPLQSGTSGDVVITREIRMPRGRHAVLVRYHLLEGSGPIVLRLRPRLPMREADSLTYCNDVLRTDVEALAAGIRCQPYDGLPALVLTWNSTQGVEFTADPDWDRGIDLAMDRARGYDDHEDWFSPGELTVTLAPGQDVVLAATIDDAPLEPRSMWSAVRRTTVSSDFAARCDRAADDFLYTHPVAGGGSRRGILAGFPWFLEWGRDTFLSLPGLTLARGDVAGCEEVLRGVLPFLVDGLVPNIFGAEIADSHYGSVDAALWFARAVLLFDRAGGDVDDELFDALVQIADAYADGTAPRIRALGIGSDIQGMVFAGTPELNPTWMDAKPWTGAVTPRHGCPVEIAGLWYSLLASIVEFAERRGEEAVRVRFADRVPAVGDAFLARFWLPEAQYLADVWRPDEVDTSVRPNMVLAAALELSPLSDAQRRAVVARAQAELLTSKGLRTLSPHHPDYVARYQGGPLKRDSAYHQGTVWPWLLGCYVEAALRAGGPSSRDELREVIEGLAVELDRAGLDHVSEVFDGDPPHRPGGTFAQAWNTAELLRAHALLSGGVPPGFPPGSSS